MTTPLDRTRALLNRPPTPPVPGQLDLEHTVTDPRILDLMALMRDIEKPSACYNRAVRRASQTLTDSPENDAAQARGNAALLEIEQAVRAWVAKHPEPANPAVSKSAEVLRIVSDADPFANGVCTYGEGRAPGSGCIKPTGHGGPHLVTPGDTDDD
ncbi:hypothetical protein AB0L83_21860 [Streptomyces sp. NPDC052071]|uniref:hypothetical protein n=1 Tax=Streptomyces sp. NPDC052071 TaxID=3156666 RepID=UPI003441C855